MKEMKRRQLTMGAILLLSLVWTQWTMAQTRIAVLSDTHVMGPGLVVEDGTAWQEALASDRKLLDYSRQIFDQLVDRMKAEQPELLLLTGDLTKDGERLSHEYVKEGLEELVAEGIKVYVTPGNHDLGTGNAYIFDGDSKTPAETIDADQFKTYYAACGYNENSDIHGLSYATEAVDGLVLIAIDSHSGAVSTDDLDWACQKASQAAAESKQVLAMMHHPLIPHINGAELYVNSATVADYETVRNRLADAGVKVILTGHFHTSDIARDWNADLTRDIYDINTGSTVSYPCDYRMLTLSDDMSTLTVSTETVSELEGVEDFSSEAEQRLMDDMVTVATNAVGNAALAQLAAQAFVIHAKGNEHQSQEANTILSLYQAAKLMLSSNADIAAKLAARGLTWDDLDAIINSIMTDTSHYGDPEREDQTDDCSLTIDMPVLTESITLADDGWATYCTDRRIDLRKTEGLTGYIVTGIGTAAVAISEVSVVPENTGMLLFGEGGSQYVLYGSGSEADETSSNLLLGTLTETDAPANAYVLANKEGQTAFYPAAASLRIPAHKAYLLINGTQAARILSNDHDAATEISLLRQSDSHANGFYTLQGIQTTRPSKGVYVNNGRLIIVK